LQNGTVVGDTTGPIGPIIYNTLAIPQYSKFQAKTKQSENNRPSVGVGFSNGDTPSSAGITVNGATYHGDEVEMLAEDPGVVVDLIDGADLTAIGPGEMIIDQESETSPDTTPPEVSNITVSLYLNAAGDPVHIHL